MSLVVKVGADLANFDRQMRRLTREISTVSDKFKDVGAKMSSAITLPILAVGAAAVKTGSEFEASMSKVAAISGASGDELSSLEQQARDLGKSTQFSASQAADGMQYLAMAGFKTNDILNAMPGLLDLAAAGALELGDAADIASNIMSGFGISTDKSGHVADVLAKAASSANTDVAQLGEAMKYLAPSAKTLGWSLEESTAAVMAMGDAGIQGSMAGQAFASSLGRLAAPTKKMNKVMKETGIAFFDANGTMKSMPDVIKELEKGTEGMTDKQKSATLTTLFGAEAYKHWAVLLDKGSDSLGKNTGMLETADGAANQMATTMNDNLMGRVKEMQSAFEEMGIIIYNALQPALEVIVSALTNLAQAFGNLSPAIQQIILAVAAFVAAIGPILGAVAIGITLFGQMQAALTILGVSFAAIAAPIAIAIAAIIGIIAIFVLFGDEIKAFWNKNFKPIIDQMISIVLTSLKPAFDEGFKTISAIVKDCFDIIKRVYYEILEPVFKVLGSFIKTILLPAFQVAFTAIGSVVSDAFKGIKSVWQNVLKPILNGIISFINGAFSGNWSKAWEGLVQIFKGVFSGLKLAAKAPINAIISMVNGLIRGLNKLSIPDWVPGVGGKGINIPTLPMLATGGSVMGSGSFIAGEAGAELIQKSGSSVKVTPLSSSEKSGGIGGALNSDVVIELVQQWNGGQVMSYINKGNARLNRARDGFLSKTV